MKTLKLTNNEYFTIRAMVVLWKSSTNYDRLRLLMPKSEAESKEQRVIDSVMKKFEL